MQDKGHLKLKLAHNVTSHHTTLNAHQLTMLKVMRRETRARKNMLISDADLMNYQFSCVTLKWVVNSLTNYHSLEHNIHQ